MSRQCTAECLPKIEEKSIYVTCPANLVTGGPELLHQLVNKLVKSGRNAVIAYLPLGEKWETPEEYRRYHCPVAQSVPDREDVAIIVPEVSTDSFRGFSKARHVIWWLSVDNYFGKLRARRDFPGYFRRFFRMDIPFIQNATHLFQSEYARQFVRDRFNRGGAMLSDYLAAEYLTSPVEGDRKNVVAYNPKKGFAYTKKIMRGSSGVRFVALENMSREQLKATLNECKVYIDFGPHPGKDRLPREAAVQGAVVIVGKRGTASYPNDVGLSPMYKFECERSSIPQIKRLILDVFSNFDWHYTEQEDYRRSIALEEEVFEEQIREIFPPRELSQDLS